MSKSASGKISLNMLRVARKRYFWAYADSVAPDQPAQSDAIVSLSASVDNTLLLKNSGQSDYTIRLHRCAGVSGDTLSAYIPDGPLLCGESHI